MKCISLWQPWASLIACGAKPFETRDWAPPRELIGQRIAIHAAKKIDKDAKALAEEWAFGQHKQLGFKLAEHLNDVVQDTPHQYCGAFGEAVFPIGGVVCTALLEAAFQLGEEAEGTALPAARVVRKLASRPIPDCFTVRLDDFGNYAPGRWAWLLRDIQVTRPFAPVVGQRGFWDLPQGWMVQ